MLMLENIETAEVQGSRTKVTICPGHRARIVVAGSCFGTVMLAGCCASELGHIDAELLWTSLGSESLARTSNACTRAVPYCRPGNLRAP